MMCPGLPPPSLWRHLPTPTPQLDREGHREGRSAVAVDGRRLPALRVHDDTWAARKVELAADDAAVGHFGDTKCALERRAAAQDVRVQELAEHIAEVV